MLQRGPGLSGSPCRVQIPRQSLSERRDGLQHGLNFGLCSRLSLYQILQIFSITLLEKMPISCVLEAFDSHSELLDDSKQMILFDI